MGWLGWCGVVVFGHARAGVCVGCQNVRVFVIEWLAWWGCESALSPTIYVYWS